MIKSKCFYTFIFLLLLQHIFELLCEIIDDLFFLEFLPSQNCIEVRLGVNNTLKQAIFRAHWYYI